MNQLFLIVLLAVSGAVRLAEGASVCDHNLCKNGGTCQPGNKGYNWGYFCTCQPGYIGAQCQWDSKQCEANTKTPCQNGGRCVSGDDGRMCACPGDTDATIKYGGHYCEIVNPCVSCPRETVYCHAAPIRATGRACLDANRVEIQWTKLN